MMKISLFIFCLLCMFGCHPPTKYTTHQEYVKTTEWDHEKGIVKHPKASWSVHWES